MTNSKTIKEEPSKEEPRDRRGAKPKFGQAMARQVSVGVDPLRDAQLQMIQAYMQVGNPANVTESDIFRLAFDRLVTELTKEVPQLANTTL